jgi:hypothetical protein
MVKSYLVIDKNNYWVYGYFKTLTAAKNEAQRLSNEFKESFSVLAIIGPEFGQGFHRYCLTINNNKWTKRIGP